MSSVSSALQSDICPPHAVLPHARLTASVIRSEAEVAILRDDWDELFQRSRCDNVFQSFPWISTWWKYVGCGRLFIVSVREVSGRLVALAPLYISERIGPLRIRRVGFLGDSLVGSDYLDVLVEHGYAAAGLRCLAATLFQHRQEWDYIDLVDTTPESYTSSALRSSFEAGGLRAEIAPSSVCPLIVLPKKPEEYLASLGPKLRKHLKYYARALQRLGETEFVTIAGGSEIEAAFDTLLRLHGARFQQRRSRSAFLGSKVAQFHLAVLRALAGAGSARIHLLRLRGEPIAAVYVLSAGKRMYFYQSGMDPAYSRYSTGSLLIHFAIEDAIRNGCSEFHFLRGDEAYKSQWINQTRQLQCVRLFDDRLRSRIAHAAQLARTSMGHCKSAVMSANVPSKAVTIARRFAPSRFLREAVRAEERSV